MKSTVFYIIYPEGDIQEIPHRLRVNQVVDINGYPLSLPLPTVKMIAYRVFRQTTRDERNETGTYYHLQLLDRSEMIEVT